MQPGAVVPATRLETATAGGRVVHSLFYRPARETHDGNPPPLVVLAHGGPTDQAVGGLRVDVQLLTGRGFAVVDVDYGGSTGYGRAFRERLAGQWGDLDVDDCVAVATSLAERTALVDGTRMAVMGGSAGGYIALCALAFHNVFCAGISFFGIADPELWDAETHKFESSYTSWLAGTHATSARARVVVQRTATASPRHGGQDRHAPEHRADGGGLRPGWPARRDALVRRRGARFPARGVSVARVSRSPRLPRSASIAAAAS